MTGFVHAAVNLVLLVLYAWHLGFYQALWFAKNVRKRMWGTSLRLAFPRKENPLADEFHETRWFWKVGRTCSRCEQDNPSAKKTYPLRKKIEARKTCSSFVAYLSWDLPSRFVKKIMTRATKFEHAAVNPGIKSLNSETNKTNQKKDHNFPSFFYNFVII